MMVRVTAGTLLQNDTQPTPMKEGRKGKGKDKRRKRKKERGGKTEQRKKEEKKA